MFWGSAWAQHSGEPQKGAEGEHTSSHPVLGEIPISLGTWLAIIKARWDHQEEETAVWARVAGDSSERSRRQAGGGDSMRIGRLSGMSSCRKCWGRWVRSVWGEGRDLLAREEKRKPQGGCLFGWAWPSYMVDSFKHQAGE